VKTRFSLTALTVVIVGALVMSAIPAESYRVRPGMPVPHFLDEDKDGKCDHASSWTHEGKGHKHGYSHANWNCPHKDVKGHGWGATGGIIYPNLPYGGHIPWGGATK
jgi:hypothetical protein